MPSFPPCLAFPSYERPLSLWFTQSNGFTHMNNHAMHAHDPNSSDCNTMHQYKKASFSQKQNSRFSRCFHGHSGFFPAQFTFFHGCDCCCYGQQSLIHRKFCEFSLAKQCQAHPACSSMNLLSIALLLEVQLSKDINLKVREHGFQQKGYTVSSYVDLTSIVGKEPHSNIKRIHKDITKQNMHITA